MGENVGQVVQTLCLSDRDESAGQLVTVLYRELRRLAHAMRGARPAAVTLQTTDLVHEAYLKLVGRDDPGWEGNAHFFGAAARAMRELLVDQARRNARVKRGGDLVRVAVDDADLRIDPPEKDMIALDEALKRLETYDSRKAEVVNLRFFAGLSAKDTADVLGVSKSTVDRDWVYIRSWLYDQLHA